MKSGNSKYSFNRKALHYEQKWRAYLRHTHKMFLQRIITGSGEVILDASGGTGLLAEELTTGQYPFRRLVLNDPSEEMLTIAQDRLRGENSISFTGYLAHELPFKKQHFNVILCLNSFHYYHEQYLILERFHDILKPGGRLYLLDWNRSGFFRVVNQLIKWSVSEYIDTRSLPELIRMAEDTGFRIKHSDRWSWRYWKFMFLEAQK